MKTIVVAIIVALLASVGTATATSYINGHSIRPNSIPANRLTAKARASFHTDHVTLRALRTLWARSANHRACWSARSEG